MSNVRVAVCLTTYNHVAFISEAIKSVMSQKTDFDFLLIIGEDCSTDGTLTVCREYERAYPTQIKVIKHDANLGLARNTICLYEYIVEKNIKYIAMLDGDDYWSDNKKLQKQIDILDNNSECGLIHTAIQLLIDGKIVNQKKRKLEEESDSHLHLPLGNCSVVFRTDLLDKLNMVDLAEQNFLSIDYITSVVFSYHTKFMYMPYNTAIWRRGHSSVSNPNNLKKEIAYIEHHINVWRYINKLYPENLFKESWGISYIEIEKLKLAYKYNNYRLAHEIASKSSIYFDEKFSMKTVRFLFAKKSLLFSIYCLILRIKSKFSK